MSNSPQKPTSWNAVASWYDDLLQPENDTYQAKVVLPNLMRLLVPAGKRVIDIACGQGFFAEAALAAGAKDVLGIDIAPDLIRIASERMSHDNRARFEVAPAHKIAKAQSAAFDTAMIVLALQNIKEMPETLAEAARVLTPGGTLVLVLNHPAFRIPKASSWGFDEAAGVQYRRVDHYGKPFSVAMEMNPGAPAAEKIHTTSFHRPLQDYFKALSKAGFAVTALEEWNSYKESEPGPRAKAENEARAEFPLFLALVARKN